MQHEIMWGPLLIFVALVAGYMVIEHIKARPRRRQRSYRSDFRRMESPAARQRRRAAQRAMGTPAPHRGFATR